MKKILLILSLFPILVFSQKSYKIPADSTILNNIGSGKNELVIRNATSNITGGVLTNLGNGVTAFVVGGGSARVVDTIYKNNTKDSIVFAISGIRYAVKDSFNLNTDSQTLSISNDTLSISGGNSVILPIYIQIDSSTINSYDVLNSQNTPPVSPSTGDVYLVGTVPTGAWVGHAKDIAEWNGSSWDFTDGVQGDFLYNATTALTYIFRSGNWVQTTGTPALNNGNTISSGLRIGTNNSRSLSFETNNVNRGRFDSIGRFYIYNLPISTDTFVNVVDENGKFGKVGKSSIVDTSVISTKANVTGLLLGYVTPTSTTTFTNKRITARVDSTTSSATPTINTDNIDTYKLTAQAVDITSFTTNLTGTPTDDQILHIVIIGTATRAIIWGSKFEASTVALPTTTVGANRLDVYFIFNTATSKWRCGGVW